MDKPDAMMPTAAVVRSVRAPEGAWDCHFHMVAGKEEFALWDGRVENPAPGLDFDGSIAR